MTDYRNLTTNSLVISMMLLASKQVFATKSPNALIPISAHELKVHLTKPNVKVSIVALWATWCQPCIREVPELIKIQEVQKRKGVQVLLVASDPDSDREEAVAFLAKHRVTFPTYRVSEPVDVFIKEFVDDWPTVVPTTLLFNNKGELEGKWYGRIEMVKLKERLKRVLSKPSKSPVATKGKVGSH
jgi:thiol-disulfide isomerase/thioredoxin